MVAVCLYALEVEELGKSGCTQYWGLRSWGSPAVHSIGG